MRIPIVNVTRCPDRGLDSLYELNDPKLNLYTWLIILVSLEQVVTLSIIGLRSYRKLTFFTSDSLTYCKLPTALILWWSVFTSASVALVGLTMRGNVSVLTKTIHVFSEAMFLVTFLSSINMTILSGVVLSVIVFMILWVLSIPECLNSVSLAVSLGVILDFANFLSYLLLAFRQNENNNLWTFVHGLGWHALYLGLFIGIHLWTAPSWFLGTLRLFGAVFNVIAVELFILLLKRILIDANLPSGWMKLSEWKSYPNSTVAWDETGLLSVKSDFKPSHNPQESAYTKEALHKFWFGYRNTTRLYNNKYVQYLFIYPVKEYDIPVDRESYVFVYDLAHTRVIRILIAFGLSFLLWAI